MTIRSWALSFGTVVIGWLALQMMVMRFTDAAPGAIVLFPADNFVTQLPDNVAVVSAGSNWVSVRSDTPDFAQKLYFAGAWIVLPAGLPGCLPLSRAAS